MQKRWFRPDKMGLVACYAVAIGLMWSLKQHYSSAAPEELWWILDPIAAIVQVLDKMAYTWTPGLGWVRADGFIIIASACAGVNFMIMLFGLSMATFLHRFDLNSKRLTWMAVALVMAYFMSIGVNTIRIMVSILCYQHQLSLGWLTPVRLHRMVGIVIYFTVLGLYYGCMDHIIRKFRRQSLKSHYRIGFLPWQPLIWYLAGTVAVPLIHNIYGGHFRLSLEYTLTVMVVSTFLWCIGSIGWFFLKKI